MLYASHLKVFIDGFSLFKGDVFVRGGSWDRTFLYMTFYSPVNYDFLYFPR